MKITRLVLLGLVSALLLAQAVAESDLLVEDEADAPRKPKRAKKRRKSRRGRAMTKEEIMKNPNIQIDAASMEGIHIEAPNSWEDEEDDYDMEAEMRRREQERARKREERRRKTSRKAKKKSKKSSRRGRAMTKEEIRKNPNIHIDAESMEGIHIEAPNSDFGGSDYDFDDRRGEEYERQRAARQREDEERYERMMEERRRRDEEFEAERARRMEEMRRSTEVPEYHIGSDHPHAKPNIERLVADEDVPGHEEHQEKLRRLREERDAHIRRAEESAEAARRLQESGEEEDIFVRARRIADEAHARARAQHLALRERHEEMMREHDRQMAEFRVRHGQFMEEHSRKMDELDQTLRENLPEGAFDDDE